MAGHGSPPPDDTANDPSRKVGRDTGDGDSDDTSTPRYADLDW